MEDKVKKKQSNYYTGLNSEEVKKKSQAILKVNGVEVSVEDYFKDPAKYNSIPMDPEYVRQVETEHTKNMETKQRLQIDPSTIKSIIHVRS